ncbi:two-component system response regulator YesN [Anaerobacterium chartisolvens]|uniref:Stage 0 sporulation protein A homolog n=1 Tax=Anaerobacterium chartisolvens TaxID=1297424 RepID=A0A369AWM8_9FIRM|nr:response regulator [Anaerobacterium chartisolvens]RCX13495.1 two-component system response regulator YesN [Anaerobacterium chartisolvens]
MHRLLIVDDEEIIVNGLYEIFSSMRALDLDVYKAYSGEEAIEWLNRTRIDIVLTDIRMPEINGLELMDIIHRSWPQCRVIFLTGYDEFEYVYKAIQHNGVSYILKTEDHDKVISVVEEAIKEIQKGIKIEDLIHKAKEQMNMARDLFQKDYFIHLLHGDPSLNITKLQFEQLEIPMYPDKPVILLLGHVDNIPADLSYWDKIQYLYSVKLVMSRYLNTNTRSVNVLNESYRFVLFIQPKELQAANSEQPETAAFYAKTISFLKGTLEVIQAACTESINASISFALGGEPCVWEDVSKKYHSLNQLLNFRIGTGIEMLLIDKEFKNNILNTASEVPELEAGSEALEGILRQKELHTLELYLESGQRDKFFETLIRLIDPLKAIRSKNSNIAIEAYYKVALSLLSYINRCKLTQKIAFCIDQNRLMRIDKHESWEEGVEYIYSLSDIIFKIQSEEQNKRADSEINHIQGFIEQHLSEDLSLVRLAEQVYLNPSYLSRLYKQVTGTNLSDFIDNARRKKAKELLEKQSVKIHEVAKSVGYESAASFTRFFRKVAGCSPQEYHEAYLTGKQMTTK